MQQLATSCRKVAAGSLLVLAVWGITLWQLSAAGETGGAAPRRFSVSPDKRPAKVPQLAGKKKSASGGLDPAAALASLDVADGLEVTLFAAEPMMLNPTNIDIDAKGRVWVCEVVNYRGRNGTRKEGDRILILEDSDGDGKADRTKVYYQGRDVDSAMGICVLGNKVIVSCSPNVWVFTDENGDDVPDKKELLFTKTGQPQHDHSAHAFVFGPDGRLYWNFGNTGHAVHDKQGKPVIDLAGNTVAAHGKPYRQGMVFRCDPDGSNFEVLGWNFRNNYEVAVDSFGTLWQSDNDDDGNRGVRINYVMEYGNFGYQDEITGAGWQKPRTNLETEIARRHWHQNDPGVVPNLVHTGAGSPTGICVYEGNLLTKPFRNQVIHADAGPNIVRAYPAVKDGAGYKATMLNLLDGARDKWFRPADVCVAPDGSVLVADWYDPGVGGHGMGDIDRGRIFRIAPPKIGYKVPKFDFTTPVGAVSALRNPALSVRYLAWTALHEMQGKAEQELLKLADAKEPAHLRARAFWLLGRIKGKEKEYIDRAVADKDPDIRIVGLRLARQSRRTELLPFYVKQLARDESPQVRRECAVALCYDKSAAAPALWAELAAQHDGKDRWYLEALGIGARNRWDECFSAWLRMVGDRWDTPAGRDIVWRSRSRETPSYLARIISDPKTPRDELPRYFRAFDFQTGPAKDDALVQLVLTEPKGGQERASFILTESISRLQGFDVSKNPRYKKALDRVLDQAKGTPEFVRLVSRFHVADRYPELMKIAQRHAGQQLGVDAVAALLDAGQFQLFREHIRQEDAKAAVATVTALAAAKDGRALGLLMPLVTDPKADVELRRQAVRAVASVRKGALALVDLAAAKKLDPQLKESAGASLHQAPWHDVKERAAQLFPLPAGKGNAPLPPLGELLTLRGDAQRGLKLFRTTGTCANCHVVHKFGKEVGPDLSEIGDKLSKQALFESILFPSAAISHNYETYLVELTNGNVTSGLLVSQTPAEVTVKTNDAILHTYKRADVAALVKQPVSLMPADLTKELSAQDLADIVEYLTTLRRVTLTPQNRKG